MIELDFAFYRAMFPEYHSIFGGLGPSDEFMSVYCAGWEL